MPLSEHEERVLAEIERQFAAEDPKFGTRRRGLPALGGWTRATRLRLAILLGVGGVITVIVGLSVTFGLAVAGMAVVFVAIVLGASALREPLVVADEPVASPQDDLP